MVIDNLKNTLKLFFKNKDDDKEEFKMKLRRNLSMDLLG